MKTILKLEELSLFILGIYFFTLLDYPWWVFVALFFLPDLSMLGYLAGIRPGAISYNFIHHKGLAVLLYLLGILTASAPLQLAGLVILAHSSLDRVLGYGLKYPDSFKNSHLGTIGKTTQVEGPLQ